MEPLVHWAWFFGGNKLFIQISEEVDNLLVNQRLIAEHARHCVQSIDRLCHGSMPGFILRAEKRRKPLAIDYEVIDLVHIALNTDTISSYYTSAQVLERPRRDPMVKQKMGSQQCDLTTFASTDAM